MIFQENDFSKTYDFLNILNEDLTSQQMLKKILGDTIWRTSNYSGQGKKYAKQIAFIKRKAALPKENWFTKFKDCGFIVAHHLNGNHTQPEIVSDTGYSRSNIIFLGFGDHSKYTQEYFKVADEFIAEYLANHNLEFSLQELDFYARLVQLNTFISKLQKEHPEELANYNKANSPVELFDLPQPDGMTSHLIRDLKDEFDKWMQKAGVKLLMDTGCAQVGLDLVNSVMQLEGDAEFVSSATQNKTKIS